MVLFILSINPSGFTVQRCFQLITCIRRIPHVAEVLCLLEGLVYVASFHAARIQNQYDKSKMYSSSSFKHNLDFVVKKIN